MSEHPPLRILFVGHTTVQYIRENWVEPLRRHYDAVIVNATLPLLAGGGRHLEGYLRHLLQERPADILFLFSDGIVHHFSAAFFDELRLRGMRVITFHSDDEPEHWYRFNARYDDYFDLIATPSLRAYQRRLGKRPAESLLYLPWGFNDTLFTPREEPSEFDIVHIGTNFWADGEEWDKESRDRLETLEQLQRHCELRGYRLRLFGADWDKHPTLGAVAGGRVSRDRMIEIYRRSRLVINPGFSKDGERATYQIKLRHFETAGCGACQLINGNPEIGPLFTPGEEIVTYDDQEDLHRKIDHLLEDGERRQLIAEAGRRRAHREHTTAARLEQLFTATRDRLFPDRLPPSPPRVRRPTIRTLCGGSLQSLLDQLRAPPDEPYDFVHIIPGPLRTIDLSYDQLPENLAEAPLDAIGVRGFLQLAGTPPEAVQRKEQTISGLFLAPMLPRGALAESHRDLLIAGDDHDLLYPLCCYLLRPARAIELCEALQAGDKERLTEMALFDSGLYITDLAPADTARLAPTPSPDWFHHLRAALVNRRWIGPTRLVICSAKGTMAEAVHRLVDDLDRHYPGTIELLGFIDRAYAGQRFLGLPVHDYPTLEALRPDVTIIAAETSGPSIRRSLDDHPAAGQILPLHDLADPIWRLMPPPNAPL